jgi:hypothetical protein
MSTRGSREGGRRISLPGVWAARVPIPAIILGIVPGMARLIALLITSTLLCSCSNVTGGVVGDYAPEWLGGTPKGVPPRPGTPEYEAFRKAQQAEADRDKSKDAAKPKAEKPKLPQ